MREWERPSFTVGLLINMNHI